MSQQTTVMAHEVERVDVGLQLQLSSRVVEDAGR